MKENITTVQYASLLYDFYGELLSESQSNIMDLYHEDNLSLSEIASELGMTRQAVHYTLKKTEGLLETYEEKLGLVHRYIDNKSKVKKALEIIDRIEENGQLDDRDAQGLEDIRDFIKELAE